LDVAFSVFGNDAVVPEIVARIQDQNGVPFRDGRPYQHNLFAARKTVDALQPSAWKENLYTAWLAAIRALSEPTTAPHFRRQCARAWAMKNLNTQLASWTELRHDTVLYAKQSYTEPLVCSYPAGFVEPVPRFWQKMKELADVGFEALSLAGRRHHYFGSSRSGRILFCAVRSGPDSVESAELLDILFEADGNAQGNRGKELAQLPLSDAETIFSKILSKGIRLSRRPPMERLYTRSELYEQAGMLLSLGRPAYNQTPGCDVWDTLVTDVTPIFQTKWLAIRRDHS
jgi:hypothetical protein